MRHRVVLVIVALTVGTLAGPPLVGAAKNFVVSAEIKNGTIRKKDLHASVRQELRRALRGIPGAPAYGPTGPRGERGPVGPTGPYGNEPGKRTYVRVDQGDGTASCVRAFPSGFTDDPVSCTADVLPAGWTNDWRAYGMTLMARLDGEMKSADVKVRLVEIDGDSEVVAVECVIPAQSLDCDKPWGSWYLAGRRSFVVEAVSTNPEIPVPPFALTYEISAQGYAPIGS